MLYLVQLHVHGAHTIFTTPVIGLNVNSMHIFHSLKIILASRHLQGPQYEYQPTPQIYILLGTKFIHLREEQQCRNVSCWWITNVR